MDWDRLFERSLLVVSGKGGTGKSTLAAALAMAGAGRGLSVLLVEVEGRAEATRTLGIEDPGYTERSTPHGFRAISITPQAAALEYFRLFVGFERVTRALLREGLIEQFIGAAPGFRDLLVCGKLYEIVGLRETDQRVAGRPRYDLVVVDAPPTGQIASFLAAPAAFADLVRVGRVKHQAAGIDRLFRSRAHVVLVSVAEEMSVAETLEAIPAVEATGVPLAAVVANRLVTAVFPRGLRRTAAALTPEAVADVVGAASLGLDRDDAAAVLASARARDRRRRLQLAEIRRLREAGDVLEVDDVPGGEGVPLVRAVAGTIRGEPVEAPNSRPRRPKVTGPAHPPGGLAPALSGSRIVVVCGSGGVGKTTVSAAIALHLGEAATRPVLLTVDPARRLATALQLPTVPGEGTDVPLGRGRRLQAIQLDTQRTFDELVRRHAGTPERRDRILANRFYRRIADTLAGTHEYMAMEKLYELAAEEDHDLIVIDTPPTRSAMSFLEAPKRLTDFLAGRFLRWLLWPTARAGRVTFGLARFGVEAFARTAGRLVGAQTLADVAEFLGAFEGMYGGFAARAARVLELLRSPECGFVLVSVPSRTGLGEAASFVSRLEESRMRPAALVANRWHLAGPTLPARARATVTGLSGRGPEDRAVAAALADRLRLEPRQAAETTAIQEFAGRHTHIPIVAVPELAEDVHDIPGLRRVAAHLFP